jgi:hypothetical protein
MNSPQRILFGDKSWLSARYVPVAQTIKKNRLYLFAKPLAIALATHGTTKISPSAAGKPPKCSAILITSS